VSNGVADLVLTGGTIYTLEPNAPIIDRGWVAVREGRIVGLGADSPPVGAHFVSTARDRDSTTKRPSLAVGGTRSPSLGVDLGLLR
jgi:hypothetical protein